MGRRVMVCGIGHLILVLRKKQIRIGAMFFMGNQQNRWLKSITPNRKYMK